MLSVNITTEEIKRHGRYGCFEVPYQFVDEIGKDGCLRLTIGPNSPLQFSSTYAISENDVQRVLDDFFYKYNSINWG